MKKFLAILLSLILGGTMLAFAACSDGGNTDTPSTGNEQQGDDEGGSQTGGDEGNTDIPGDTTEQQSPATSGDSESDTLVVYFSWSGNTQEMADYIAEQTGAYLVEILPEEPYEGSYNDVAYGRAQEEAEQNARPAVSQATYDLIDMENYDTILIGFPIWWHTAPMVIGTFLEHYDWTGKDIYPFSQSASMDEGQFAESEQFVRDCAENATVHNGLFVRPSATQAIDAYLAENGLVDGASDTPEAPPVEESTDVLVVYFSATGNTERVAGYIAETTGGDLFELVPVDPYTSDDLRWTDDDSRVVQEYEQKQAGTLAMVELTDVTVDGWENYDIVFLGFPIWWYEAAWPVYDFVESNDFTGKTIYTFCTSSSSNLGDSTQVLAEMAGGNGTWLDGQRFSSGASEATVTSWIESLNIL